MKRIFSYIIVATVAAVVFVSCSSDDNPFPKMSDDLSIIYASTSSATRASINTTPDDDGNYDVVWEEDDHILVVDNVGNQKEFQLIEGAGTTYGQFKECDASQTLSDGTFTAYYPVSSYDPTNGTFKWTVGSQKFSEGIGFSGVPMKATPSEPIADKRVPNFTFSNEAGIFKVNIKANEDVAAAEVRIGKITVKVKGADDASITYDNPGFLTTDGNTYYIMMPYQTIQAGECQFQIEDHKSRPFCMATNTGAITIEQSKINSTYITVAEDNPGYLCFHEYSNLAPCTVQLVPLDEGEDDGWKTASGKVRKASQPKTADPNPNPRELEYSYNLIKWYEYEGSPVEYDKLEHVFFRRKPSKGDAREFNSKNDIMRFKVVAGEGDTPMGVMNAGTRVFGNVMSIIDGTCASKVIPNDYCFAYLFCDNEDICEVAYLHLPATTLTKACYKNMFKNTAIKYFYGNSSYRPQMSTPIVAAPQDGKLPESCYEGMFKREIDNSLTNWLKDVQFEGLGTVTTIGKSSCKSMFEGRSALETPILYSAVNEVGENGCERMYYNCNKLAKAPTLPATVLKEACYRGMFRNCTSLTTLPTISATTLAKDCCREMFHSCSKLNMPTDYTLPAATLAENCYYDMFHNCTALNTVNEDLLENTTTLASFCCYYMFGGCTNLQNAPDLPATTLAENCYYRMFYNCKALQEVPKLQATKLASACYREMFYGCTTLTCGTALPATNTDGVAGCYSGMFKGCTSLKKLADGASNTASNNLPSGYVNTQCYKSMFEGCTSLTAAPTISAETIGPSGCERMFYGCTSLTVAPTLENVESLGANGSDSNCKQMFMDCTGLKTAPPNLKATELRKSCYESMFQGCTSLVTGPVLHAEVVSSSTTKDCYKQMFKNCSNLNEVTVYLNAWHRVAENWLDSVALEGTILAKPENVKTLSNNSYQNNASYCPTGWSVQPIPNN